ncbi:hypothetical protein [Xenorhabdus griffiniae]|uniref:Uncharacterized protein n=1 Tax=Xenorhabdus griffiniae TaxID=351672 RepID=A0ABY9XKN1_9GAMM|nr:hypothetical protein [Xenorhabdus griffiniae]MBD1229245.1 hypothetical protein [Xenorhabdus griffiniae]MBE8589002.1 hypothetical protein [Xenorhabdus griffiniae]WMV73499.1 hypothetical protein QL128_05610 [Xenorhabdus griffiniae]WNH03179.1 hypothetical protein QL112_005615 [Xenorhabdus griffiniae]
MTKILRSNKPANAKTRRLAKQNEFWDRKRAEYEAKPKNRSVGEIWDSIFGQPVDEIDVLANLFAQLKKDESDNNSGSCCMSDVALYSTKTNSRRRLASGNVTARV